MSGKHILTAALLLSLSWVAPSWAETINIVANEQTQTVNFRAAKDKLDVLGNENTLTVKGQGDKIDVMGNENRIIVDAQVRKLDLMGNKNVIKIVRRQGRPEPKVSHLGRDNRVEYEDGK